MWETQLPNWRVCLFDLAVCVTCACAVIVTDEHHGTGPPSHLPTAAATSTQPSGALAPSGSGGGASRPARPAASSLSTASSGSGGGSTLGSGAVAVGGGVHGSLGATSGAGSTGPSPVLGLGAGRLGTLAPAPAPVAAPPVAARAGTPDQEPPAVDLFQAFGMVPQIRPTVRVEPTVTDKRSARLQADATVDLGDSAWGVDDDIR